MKGRNNIYTNVSAPNKPNTARELGGRYHYAPSAGADGGDIEVGVLTVHHEQNPQPFLRDPPTNSPIKPLVKIFN